MGVPVPGSLFPWSLIQWFMGPSLAIVALVTLPAPAPAFNQAGCGAGECADCHQMDPAEAAGLVAGMANTVESVGFARIPGLFEVRTVSKGHRFPLFVDFSKSWVLQANVARVRGKPVPADSARAAVPTGASPAPAEKPKGTPPPPLKGGGPERADLGQLDPEGSLVLGKPEAKTRVVVFTDPQCPWCRKLHEEMKKAVESDSSVAFLIRMLPLKSHEGAYDLCKRVVCAGTLAALEDAMAGKKLPAAACDGKALDQAIAFAKRYRISSTPTLVTPDGRVVPGFRKAAEILSLLGPSP